MDSSPGAGNTQSQRPPGHRGQGGRPNLREGVPKGTSRAPRPTRLCGIWVPAGNRVPPSPQPHPFPGAHLSPRARPGRLAGLGGFPQSEVIGGPLRRSAETLRSPADAREAGHPVLPGGRTSVAAGPPLGAAGRRFWLARISSAGAAASRQDFSVAPRFEGDHPGPDHACRFLRPSSPPSPHGRGPGPG